MRYLAVLMLLFGSVGVTCTSAAAAPVSAVVSDLQAISARPACPDDVSKRTDPEAEVEPSVAVNPSNPDNIVAAWYQNSIAVGVSMDGGATWQQVVPPGMGLCTGGTDTLVANAWLSFGAPDPSGARTLYLTAELAPHLVQALATEVVKVVVSHSRDGGQTWSQPTVVDENPATGRNEAPTITADPRVSGRAYAVWSKRYALYAPSAAYLSRTDDGGTTWTTPQAIYRPAGALDSVLDDRLRVLPDGTVLHVFLWDPTDENDPLVGPRVHEMAQLLDAQGAPLPGPAGAGTEIATTSRTSPTDPRTGADFTVNAAPSLALAPDGTAYVTWQDITTTAAPESNSGTEGTYASIVHVARSADGGRTWQELTPAKQEASQAFLPAVAVDGDGNVGVLFTDFRNDTADGPTADDPDGRLTTDVWLEQSRDGGATWSETHVAGSSDLRAGDETGYVGSYQGVAGLLHGFAASFVLAKPQAFEGPQDVFFARVAGRGPSTAVPNLLRVSGTSPVPGGPTDTCSPLAQPLGLRNYEYSPSLAVDPGNPNHLVTTWVQDFRDAVPAAVSLDGGATWRETVPPGFLSCANGPTGSNSAIDPHVSIGADGTAYAVAVVQNASGSNSAIAFTSSRDGGLTWRSQPVQLDAPAGYSIEWSAIAADPGHPGVAYAAWDRHQGTESPLGGALMRGDQYVVRTSDWGEHWTPVPLMAPEGRVWTGASLLVLKDGTLLDAFTDIPATTVIPGVTPFPQGAVRVARRPAGAMGWTLAPQAIGDAATPFADLAAGGGRVYVAAVSTFDGTASIARSDDGGRTFSPSAPFVGSGGPTPIAMLNIAATAQGTLGVLYDVITPDQRYQTRLARSLDASATFDDAAVTGPMDPSSLPAQGGAENGGVGTYQGFRPGPDEAFDVALTFINPTADTGVHGATDVVFAQR